MRKVTGVSLRLAGVAADGGEAGKSKAFEQVRERLVKNAQDVPAWIDYGNLLWGEGKPLIAASLMSAPCGLNSRERGRSQ